jgi:hypothetical protein
LEDEGLTSDWSDGNLRAMRPRQLVESQIFRKIDEDCERVAVAVVRSGVAEFYYSVASEHSLHKSLRGFEGDRIAMCSEDRVYVSRGLRRACRRFKVRPPSFLDC